MNGSVIWQPLKTAVDPQAIVDRVQAMVHDARPPFDNRLLEMLSAISHGLLADPVAKRIPQYVALAYWLRPASLTRLRDSLPASEQPGSLRIARGVALHLPPTNVDTIFVYSWALSVLCGNANVVRLSEHLSNDQDWLVQSIAEIVRMHGEHDRQLFCTYPYGSEFEAAISRLCDLRLIWGGDEKVGTVSKIPIRPDGLSIGMPDRKSFAIIASASYREASADERDALATNFYNDLFWFDQMGCGSPRLLVWSGATHGAETDFYERLMKVVQSRGYQVETGIAIAKMGVGNDLLAENISVSQSAFCNEFHVSRVIDPVAAVRRGMGGGFLCDWVVEDFDMVVPIVSRVIQTITYFGLSSDQTMQLARRCAGRGGYRIVPVGQALQFDATWDGVKLVDHMTRSIVVR